MTKLLQIIVAGLAAVSLSAIAADDKAGASSDVKTDKPVKRSAKKAEKHDEKHDKQDKHSGAGGTKADTRTEAAPAPAPEKTK